MRIKIDVMSAKSFLKVLDRAIMIPIDRKLWVVFENTGGNHYLLTEMINNFIACDTPREKNNAKTITNS